MGDIHMKVKLTNSYDETRARLGENPRTAIRVYEADALVDTGAVRCVIPIHVVQQLGLGTRGQRVAEYADGRREVVNMTEPVLFEILGRDTAAEALILGDEVRVGQPVLEKLDLLADCTNRRVIPNPAHPDQPVTKIKRVRPDSVVLLTPSLSGK